MIKHNAGYTVVEVLVSIVGVGAVAALIVGIYVLCHFIAKMW